MKTYTVILTDGRKQEIRAPRTLLDLSAGMFERIYSGEWNGLNTPESLVKLFSIITNVDYKDYMSSTDGRLEGIIMQGTQFVYDKSVVLDELAVPTFFKYRNKLIQVPTRLRNMTLGQNLFIRRCLYGKDQRNGICLAVAVYLQPKIDEGAFNSERVEELAAEFREWDIAEIYPLGSFILRRLKQNGNGPTSFWLQTWSTMQSTIPVVVRLLKSAKLNYLIPTIQYLSFERTVHSFRHIHPPRHIKKTLRLLSRSLVKISERVSFRNAVNILKNG